MNISEKLTVAFIQADLVWEHPDANRKQFSKKMNAISSPVDMIVLPELFTTGFTMNADFAETMNGKTVQWMQEIANQKQAVVMGSSIISDNNMFYNRLLFVYPTGKIGFYDKRHLFTLANEHKVFSAGTKRHIFEYKGWSICPLICYDLRFPVWSRNTENYDLLIYVANWPKSRIDAWRSLLKARAIENLSYTIGVNRTGIDGNNFEHNGQSLAFDFLGSKLNTLTENEQTFIVELDKGRQNNTRDTLGFLNDRDSYIINK